MNIRKDAGTDTPRTGKYTGKGCFAIVQVKAGAGSDAGWGKLKSGAGWVALDFLEKFGAKGAGRRRQKTYKIRLS